MSSRIQRCVLAREVDYKPLCKFSSIIEPLFSKLEQNCGIPGTSLGAIHVCSFVGTFDDDDRIVLIRWHSKVARL